MNLVRTGNLFRSLLFSSNARYIWKKKRLQHQLPTITGVSEVQLAAMVYRKHQCYVSQSRPVTCSYYL